MTGALGGSVNPWDGYRGAGVNPGLCMPADIPGQSGSENRELS